MITNRYYMKHDVQLSSFNVRLDTCQSIFSSACGNHPGY